MADDLAQRRLDIVRNHMEAENALDFDAAIATFEHPRYELFGAGEVFDGFKEVSAYYRLSRTAFPDQRNEIISLRQCGDAVITEFWLLGTHKGPLPLPDGELPPTGKAFKVRMCAFFEFTDENIICERIYFDRLSLMEQLMAK